ncbi:MAG: hypothetical protein IPP14_09025 [Planctomycetes bacterium]|nr:hypothetical protein [Planctomycetota bacterium]
MSNLSSRNIARISFATLILGLLAGIAVTSIGLRADAQPEKPFKVAYVDFLNLLKDDKKLKRDNLKIAIEAERQMAQLQADSQPKLEELQDSLKNLKPHQAAYVSQMSKLIDLNRKFIEERLRIETAGQTEVRDSAIQAYIELRTLVTNLAKERGYSQVLNIVRNPEKVAEAQGDVRALQQQLLISPVIYYEPADDLTDLVAAEAAKTRNIDIKVSLKEAVAIGADGKAGAALSHLVKDDTANPDKIDFELKLGESIQLKVDVLDKGATAQGDNARVVWNRMGVRTGTIDDNGKFTAPAEAPKRNNGDLDDVVTLVCRSMEDPTVSVEVRIRLLNKEGKRLVEKK